MISYLDRRTSQNTGHRTNIPIRHSNYLDHILGPSRDKSIQHLLKPSASLISTIRIELRNKWKHKTTHTPSNVRLAAYSQPHVYYCYMNTTTAIKLFKAYSASVRSRAYWLDIEPTLDVTIGTIFLCMAVVSIFLPIVMSKWPPYIPKKRTKEEQHKKHTQFASQLFQILGKFTLNVIEFWFETRPFVTFEIRIGQFNCDFLGIWAWITCQRVERS